MEFQTAVDTDYNYTQQHGGAYKHVKSEVPGTKDHMPYDKKVKKRPSSCKVLQVNSGGPVGERTGREAGRGWLLVLDLGMSHLQKSMELCTLRSLCTLLNVC